MLSLIAVLMLSVVSTASRECTLPSEGMLFVGDPDPSSPLTFCPANSDPTVDCVIPGEYWSMILASWNYPLVPACPTGYTQSAECRAWSYDVLHDCLCTRWAEFAECYCNCQGMPNEPPCEMGCIQNLSSMIKLCNRERDEFILNHCCIANP